MRAAEEGRAHLGNGFGEAYDGICSALGIDLLYFQTNVSHHMHREFRAGHDNCDEHSAAAMCVHVCSIAQRNVCTRIHSHSSRDLACMFAANSLRI